MSILLDILNEEKGRLKRLMVLYKKAKNYAFLERTKYNLDEVTIAINSINKWKEERINKMDNELKYFIEAINNNVKNKPSQLIFNWVKDGKIDLDQFEYLSFKFIHKNSISNN